MRWLLLMITATNFARAETMLENSTIPSRIGESHLEDMELPPRFQDTESADITSSHAISNSLPLTVGTTDERQISTSSSKVERFFQIFSKIQTYVNKNSNFQDSEFNNNPFIPYSNVQSTGSTFILSDEGTSKEKQLNSQKEIEKSEKVTGNLDLRANIEEPLKDVAQRKEGFDEVRHKSDEEWKTNYQSVVEGEDPGNEASTSVATLGTTPQDYMESVLFKSKINFFKKLINNYTSPSKELNFSTAEMGELIDHREDDKPTGPILIFEEVPRGDSYEMDKLGLTDGIFLFTYLGEFLSFIQPEDFPIELLRDALWKRLSVISLILQSLKVEAGFITCLTIGLMFSLLIPGFVLAAMCSNTCASKKEIADSASMNGSSKTNCTRRTLVCTLFVIIVMIGVGATAMIVTNEQLSLAVLNTPRIFSAALTDASAYVRNAHRHLVHVTLGSLDTALDSLYSDLENIDGLLGRPIQKEVAAETGVDVALDSLVDVASVTDDLAKKVGQIQDMSLEMRDMSMETRDRLADLRNQVDTLRRACPSRDRPLCDTIESNGLDITIRSDGLSTDSRLAILRSMESGNLPKLAERMRNRFADIPTDISSSTREIRDGIKRELEHHKASLDSSLWPIESLARDIRSRVNDARETANTIEEAVTEVEQWRWLSKLVTTLIVLIIWCLLFCALIYGCCDGESKARSFLIASLAISSLFSIILWTIALAVLVVGGHGEVFVCRPLYDKPDYRSLTRLVDDPGVIYNKGGGFFKNLLSKNQTLNVPIRKILQECEENKSAYDAFRLKNILDLESTTNYRDWGALFSHLRNLDRNFTQLDFLDPELQERLYTLLHATAVNMTAHRSLISKPITGKDLASFAKQLDSVANQIKDLSTASRIETLASRTRRLITSNIQPLESKKDELSFMVTALEVQIVPLQRQVNQTISHLKTIQFYINNQGTNITETKVSEYTSRLVGYLDQYKEHLANSLNRSLAPCFPVWNIFHGVRHQICRQIMDPLNGFWFALVWCLVWLAIGTPVCIKLMHYYKLTKEGLLCSTSSSMISTDRTNGWSAGTDENNW